MSEKDIEDEISRRCSLCAIDWPDTEDYATCPQCLNDEGTDRCRGVRPLPDDEARSMKLRFQFEWFYEEWDAARDPARLAADAPPIVVPD